MAAELERHTHQADPVDSSVGAEPLAGRYGEARRQSAPKMSVHSSIWRLVVSVSEFMEILDGNGI